MAARRYGDDPQRHARRPAASALAIGCRMTAPELRPYQSDVIEQFHRTRERQASHHPGGADRSRQDRHRRRHHPHHSFVRQNPCWCSRIGARSSRRPARNLRDAGIRTASFRPDFTPRPLELVQVASIQTLHARAIHTGRMDLPPADLLVIDECHHAPAETYRKIIDAYPDAILLGLTATPCRGDGRGLGGIFETMIECPQVAELIEQGYLVSTRVYAPIDPDLKGVRTVSRRLRRRRNSPSAWIGRKLVGDIVTHWHKFGERRKTVAFAVNVAHSIHIRDEFIKSGVRAEHIDGSTPKPERDATLARLASGEIELVTNCMVLTEGWDMPEVGCCILARPTQKDGPLSPDDRPRAAARPTASPTRSCSIKRRRVPPRLRRGSGRMDARSRSPRREPDASAAVRTKHASRLLECTQCGAVRIAGEPCFHCGFLPQRAAARGAIRRRRARPGRRSTPRQRQRLRSGERERWHAMLI